MRKLILIATLLGFAVCTITASSAVLKPASGSGNTTATLHTKTVHAKHHKKHKKHRKHRGHAKKHHHKHRKHGNSR